MISGLLVSVYDRGAATCAGTICAGENQQAYACIFQSCTPVVTGGVPDPAQVATDISGQASFSLPPGQYIVLGGDGSNKHLAARVNLSCGSVAGRDLRVIVNYRGESIPAAVTTRTGSLLHVVEPQEVVWNESQEVYPFVFIAEGDWLETATVTPPEGFVADYNALSALVQDGTTNAVQFTLTDIGSDWVPTLTRHELVHNERVEIVVGEIDVTLDQSFAASKGLDVKGRPLGNGGQTNAVPLPPPPSARLEGWIEAGPVDPMWTFKVELFEDTSLTLVIETTGGAVMSAIVEATDLAAGNYTYAWDSTSINDAVRLSDLVVRITADHVDRTYALRIAPRAPRDPLLPRWPRPPEDPRPVDLDRP